MAFAIEWDQTGEKIYETGCDHGVIYLQDGASYPEGEAWNGLISVTENPSGGEATKLYADNIPYVVLRSAEEYGITVECYTYPDSFKECDGSKEIAKGLTIGQQERKNFGLSYRTKVGNDTDGDSHGYKIHIVYGCSVSPSEKGHQTTNDSPDAITFSYEATSTPVNVPGNSPASSFEIDSRTTPASVLSAIEDILYGKAAVDSTPAVKARLPMPSELLQIFNTSNASIASEEY